MSAVKQPKKRRLPKRRHSLAGTRANQPKEEGGKSLFKLLMNKPWKRRSVSTPAIDKEVESRCRDTNEGAGSRVKVVVSVLQPGLYYKSVPVTTGTTVNDVIVELVSKYAVLEEDMDPTAFYLMETHDRSQGSYSRVLTNSDEVEAIQLSWGRDPRYFTLTRQPKSVKTDPLFSSSPTLLPTSVETTLFPYPVFVEEGASQLSSQSLSDLTTSHHTSPQKHSTSHAIPSLVSPYSNGASRKTTRLERANGSLPKLPDNVTFSSTADSATSLSPPGITSPLIVDSPTHQYIITGSSSLNRHSNNGRHGTSTGDGSKFHFPSADPTSPTAASNYSNNIFSSPPNGEEERGEGVRREREERGRRESAEDGRLKEGVCESSVEKVKGERGEREEREMREKGESGERGEKGESGEGAGDMTPNTRRRRRLSELMQSSIEGGLGHIMTMVVGEGREGEGDEEGEGEEVEEGEGEGEGEGFAQRKGDEKEEGEGEVEGKIEGERGGEGEGEEERGEREEGEEVCGRSEEEDGEKSRDKQLNDDEDEESNSQTLEPIHVKPISQHPTVITMATTPDLPPETAAQIVTHSTTREASLTVRQSTTATLDLSDHPKNKSNQSDWFESEMDIFDSFATMLEEAFGTESKPTNGTETQSPPTQQKVQEVSTTPEKTACPEKQVRPVNLVSPLRRDKLIEQAAKKVILKHAHTFDAGTGHAQTSHTHSGVDLVSSARRERLLSQAAASVRRRLHQQSSLSWEPAGDSSKQSSMC